MIGSRFATEKFLKKLDHLAWGSLTVTTPDGKSYTFSGDQEGEEADIILHSWDVVPNVAMHGDIGFAEDYRDGKWSTSGLRALLIVAAKNGHAVQDYIQGNFWGRIFARVSYLFKQNTIRNSRKNIHAHYDIGNEFYKLWLDKTMTYSAALFTDEDEDLEVAQLQKYKRILDKFENAGRILEIGCGWGGFAERALLSGHSVKCLTLSKEQHKYATERLNEGADVVLQDYRHEIEKFDNVVSIEMFEAVGEKYWPTYFKKIKECLKPEGRAIVQTITICEEDFDSYKRGGDMIRTFIFPGGMLPSPSKFEEIAAQEGLKLVEAYHFPLDYAKTLTLWLEKFDARREKIMALGFDEAFMRLWRFYLCYCIAGFQSGRTSVMQAELVHS